MIGMKWLSFLGYTFGRLHSPKTGKAYLGSKQDDAESGWLRETLAHRSIGAVAMEHAFYPVTVTDHFDALVFVSKTNPSVQLDTPRAVPGA